jgi:hypothetical protein
MKDVITTCSGRDGGVALYESLSDFEGYYYCSKCGRALKKQDA